MNIAIVKGAAEMSSQDDLNRRRRKFRTLYEGGQLAGCSAVSERIIALHKRFHTDGSAEYADDVYNYAAVNTELGLYGFAAKLYEESAGIYRALGLNDRLFCCLVNLSAAHALHGGENAALESADEAVLLAQGLSPADEIDAVYNKAGIMRSFEKNDEAIELYTLITSAADDKLLIADAYANIGFCLQSQAGENNEAAAKALRKALSHYKAAQGEYSEDYLAMVYHLAQFHAYTKSYEESVKYYGEAARIIKRTFSDKGAYYTDTVNRMADMHSLLGNLDRSLFLRLKALRLMKSQIGEEHIYYANNLKNAALIYREKGDIVKAEEYLLRSVDIKGRILGGSNPDCVRDVFQLCSMYIERSDYDNALAMLKKTAASLDERGGAMKEIACEITGICKNIAGTGEKSVKEFEALERLRSIEKRMLSDAELWF